MTTDLNDRAAHDGAITGRRRRRRRSEARVPVEHGTRARHLAAGCDESGRGKIAHADSCARSRRRGGAHPRRAPTSRATRRLLTERTQSGCSEETSSGCAEANTTPRQPHRRMSRPIHAAMHAAFSRSILSPKPSIVTSGPRQRASVTRARSPSESAWNGRCQVGIEFNPTAIIRFKLSAPTCDTTAWSGAQARFSFAGRPKHDLRVVDLPELENPTMSPIEKPSGDL